MLTDYNNALCTLRHLQIIFQGCLRDQQVASFVGSMAVLTKNKGRNIGDHSAWCGPSSHLERPVESEVQHTGPTPRRTVSYIPPLFLVRTAMDHTNLATCWSFTGPWENNLQMHQSTQSIIIISKQPVAPKSHILKLSPTIIVRQ